MTKQEYIQKHPKSTLAARLACNNWPDDQKINVIGGLDAPHTKCSNLYRALQKADLKDYCLGGHRQRGTEGWWIAVA
jgi:hypothetical protein